MFQLLIILKLSIFLFYLWFNIFSIVLRPNYQAFTLSFISLKIEKQVYKNSGSLHPTQTLIQLAQNWVSHFIGGTQNSTLELFFSKTRK